MELKTNSKCQLILDGDKPETGLEVIVYGDNVKTVIREEYESNYWKFDMPEDGLYQYFVLQFDVEPTDILKHINEYSLIPEVEIFSICKLRKCLLSKEKDYISKFLKGCTNGSGHCSNSNEEDMNRDFLLSTIFVLEHLICTGQITEATRILKNISSCSLCSNGKTINNCGCNGANS